MSKENYYLSTPILRALASKLHDLDIKVTKTFIKADQWIKSNKSLRFLTSNDLDADLKRVQPFLDQDLIEKTVKECVARERLVAQLPKPGGSWMEQAAVQSTLNKHNEKVERSQAERCFDLLKKECL